MTILLPRGQGPASAPEGCLLIQIGTAPAVSAGQKISVATGQTDSVATGRTISIDWTGTEPQAIISDKNQIQGPFAFQADGAFFRYALSPEFTIWTAVQNLDEFPESLWEKGAGVYLPFQGWREQAWKDGPILHFQEKGPMNIVLAGRAGVLQAEDAPVIADWKDFWMQERFASWKDSLMEAYRQRWSPQKFSSLELIRWDAHTLLHLLLLRLSFPDCRFFVGSLPAEQTPGWKRLCQNLNVELPKVLPPSAPLLKEPSSWAQPEFLRDFLIAIQKNAPFIPLHLAETFGVAKPS